MIGAIQRHGGQPKLTIYHRRGHNICGAVCKRNDLWAWMFEQRRTQYRFTLIHACLRLRFDNLVFADKLY